MIQGEIHTFPLPDLIQWLALTHRTGMLVIAQGADSVERYSAERGPTAGTGQAPARVSVQLHFVAGEIAAASMSELAILDSPEKVRTMLSSALNWRSGRFAFSASPPPEWVLASNLRLSAEALLLEAAAQTVQGQEPEAEPGLGEWAEVEEHSEGFRLGDALRLQVVDRLLKEDFSVPAMPHLAARVLELTRDEDFSLRALENLVLTDQAVAARILRYANSVLLGGERRVDSLGLAIQRLGTDEVVNIVIAASLQARRLGYDLFAAEKSRLSLRSLVAAFLARSLAARAGLNSHLGFLCGLLMDFGMTVLYSLIQQALAPARAKSEPIPTRVIEEIVRDYHPRVGRVVGERWQLPSPVIETMAHHHCLSEVVSDKPYVAIGALADALTTFALGIARADLEEALARFQPERLHSHQAAQFLGFSLDDASAVLKDLPRCLDQALEFVVK
jgi:HD-like signal output (HDOD) protein